MGISIIKKNIEEKFNPFIDIENFFNRENYEELFIDYYNDFYNKYILSFVGDNLSSSELNRINNYYNEQSPRMRILVNEGEFVGHFYSNKLYVKKLQK